MYDRTYQRILGMLAYHEAVRKRGASYAQKNRPISIAPICGGNAEIDLQALVVGRFVDEPRARKAAGSLNAPSFGAAIILRLPY